MIRFEDLEFKDHPLKLEVLTGFSRYVDAVRCIKWFDNNFGASIVRFHGSYGYEKGLYEIGILCKRPKNWGISYQTIMTNDVIGYLTEEDVVQHLFFVERLEQFTGDKEDYGWRDRDTEMLWKLIFYGT